MGTTDYATSICRKAGRAAAIEDPPEAEGSVRAVNLMLFIFWA